MDARSFEDCLIHGLIRDKQGRKFSKSLGNGIDPFDMVDLYGADALHYYLATDVAPGTDMRFDEEKIKSTWNFINKIWNAARFVLAGLKDIKEIKLENLKKEDKWILTKLEDAIDETKKFMDKYEFNNAGASIYEFTWNYFCDYYIEMSKYSLDSESTKSTLCFVLTRNTKYFQTQSTQVFILKKQKQKEKKRHEKNKLVIYKTPLQEEKIYWLMRIMSRKLQKILSKWIE